MKMKIDVVKLPLLVIFCLSIFSCYNDDDGYGAGSPINERLSTFEIIQNSPDHTVLTQLLTSTGLRETLNEGTFTVFAPTDAAFESLETSELSDEEITNILLNHVVEGAAESSNLESSYLNTLATETFTGEDNQLSLYVEVGASVTLNGSSSVTGPDNLASDGVVHSVDEVIRIPDLTTFVAADPELSTLLEALTREDQPDFLETLSSFDDSDAAPFTVFAPTNAAFTALLNELGDDDLSSINANILTSVLNTHVIAEANLTSLDFTTGTVETLGNNFELDAEELTITDLNERIIDISITDVQAGNGVIHMVSTVVLPAM